jgi:hypothetical protein
MFFIRTWPEEKITKKQKRLFNLVARPLAHVLTLGCRDYTYGLENRVERGANAIFCTHGIEERDVAKIVLDWTKKQQTKDSKTEFHDGRRNIFFATNKELYNIDDFMKLGEKTVKRRWGPDGMDYKILGLIRRGKLIAPLAKVVTSNVEGAGCIPIDIRGGSNSQGMKMIKDYLLEQRVVALIQYYHKEDKSETPLFKIKPGGLLILYQLYKENGLDVPITLMTVKKSRDDLISNIGTPDFISRFYVPGNMRKTISDAQACLEDKQAKLYYQY